MYREYFLSVKYDTLPHFACLLIFFLQTAHTFVIHCKTENQAVEFVHCSKLMKEMNDNFNSIGTYIYANNIDYNKTIAT